MWAANIQQVFTENPQKQKYDCWVLFLRHESDTGGEKFIRAKHQNIDTILAAQNVNYAEITTHSGREVVYEKFNSRKGEHPLFLILNKHPVAYRKNDLLMVIEWGKWADIENLQNDVMALTNFFSHEKFRRSVVDAQNPKMWRQVGVFLERNGISILKIGATIAAALA